MFTGKVLTKSLSQQTDSDAEFGTVIICSKVYEAQQLILQQLQKVNSRLDDVENRVQKQGHSKGR